MIVCSFDAAAAVWKPVEIGFTMYLLFEQKRMISRISCEDCGNTTAAGRGSHCEPSWFIVSGF
jgi:hypothetical protein